MNGTQRIGLNACALGLRSAVTAALFLVSSRFVLAGLGVVDYGLVSLVVGIMGLIGFLNTAVTASSQRQLAFEVGRGDRIRLRRAFNTSFCLHAGLAILFVILGETLGIWLLNHVLIIPEARRQAAFWVCQFTIFSAVGWVLLGPYHALLTAHEILSVGASAGVVQAVLVLFVALWLPHAAGDRLVRYVMLVCLADTAATGLQIAFCRWKFRGESQIAPVRLFDWRLAREMLACGGWNLVGALTNVTRLHGMAMLLNAFLGPVINAAYGIANQLGTAVGQFTQSLLQAVSPRIIRHEGAGSREQMVGLALLACKYAFFLASLWIIPLVVELPAVLSLWLKHPPEHTLAFGRIVLLAFLLDQLSASLGSVALATGRQARYQSVIGVIQLAALLLAFLLLRRGFSPALVLGSTLLATAITVFVRGLALPWPAGAGYARWFRSVVGRGVAGVLPACAVAALLAGLLPPSTLRLLVLPVVVGVVALAGMYVAGMSGEEQGAVRAQVRALRFSLNR